MEKYDIIHSSHPDPGKQEKLLFPIQNLDSLPGKGAAAVCHSRMFLSGIHSHKIIDSGQKNAGMTDFWSPGTIK
ncbi:MAG: hypothetical protein GQ561_00205 [Calditrichae bacterium]|nr:hypothetical protein [Calditrichia bacterium]